MNVQIMCKLWKIVDLLLCKLELYKKILHNDLVKY